MREHAIPQDITGYRFHIIGNMTLKQFAEVGLGCFVGFLFYTTNLPAVIKWPLIGICVGLGAMVAFVPVEERPLDHWLTTFFKVLYKPTKFFWRREPKIPEAFTYTPHEPATTDLQEIDLRPARKQRIREYLRSVEPPKAIDQFDWAQLQQIDSIMTTFNQVAVNSVQIQESVQKPDLKVRVRSLAPQAEVPEVTIDTPTIILPEPKLNVEHVETAILDQTQNMSEYQNLTDTARVRNNYAGLTTEEVAQSVSIPEIQTVDIQPTIKAPTTDSTQLEVTSQQQGVYVTDVAPATITQAQQQATLNAQLPFPTMPTEPNKIVGMILTPANDLIEGAIIEIQNAAGQVVRAVKSNSLGQFFITTPLENGVYTILVDKEGYSFTPSQLELIGTVLPPIEIRSA